jgi:hypothetical protein
MLTYVIVIFVPVLFVHRLYVRIRESTIQTQVNRGGKGRARAPCSPLTLNKGAGVLNLIVSLH